MAVDARKRCISDEMSLHCVVSHVYDRMEQLGVVIFSEINQVEVTASRGLARSFLRLVARAQAADSRRKALSSVRRTHSTT